MKKYIILFSLMTYSVLFAQNPEIKPELPTVIPPSPTVSALMKFEEVPVSNYTGTPDISIPLFQTNTLSKDINLDLSLKYHPASIGANEAASDVGLGWSLFAGGTISRTVRGLPDEMLDYNENSIKIGLYHTDLQNYKNNYYNFNNNFTTADKRDYVPNSISIQDSLLVNKFLWETKELGRYDTEHDLWQFNFMGQSGRFYIKKNPQNNQLEVVPLDNYRVIITYNYNTVNNNPYTPLSFTIYDEKGYKYIFDIIESSSNKTAVIESWGGATSDRYSTSYERENITSIQLSEVIDNNNKSLLKFEYTNVGEYYDLKIDKSFTYNNFPYNFDYNMMAEHYNINNEIKPRKTNTTFTSNNKVRKLKRIKILNFGDIFLNYSFQRNDSNLQNGYALSDIEIKNEKNVLVKKVEFNYDYSTIYEDANNTIKIKRLILKSLKEVYQSTFNNEYEFDYYDQSSNGYSVSTDYWGYFNLIPSCIVDNHIRRTPSPEFSTRDLLKKIKYPTGACAIFDFESNTYSFEGDDEIQDYFQDDQNIQLTNNSTLIFNNQNTIYNLGVLSNNYKKIVFSSSLFISDISNANRTIILQKKINNNWISAGLNLSCFTPNCCVEFYPESNIEYRIKYSNLDTNFNGFETVTIDYYSANLINQFLKGGGNRIKRIAYFNDNVDKNYYENNTNETPSKLINYSYQIPNNINKSSGSLVYVKPKFKTERSFSYSAGKCQLPHLHSDVFYFSETSQNIYAGIKTHGGDVGYKYVVVSQTGNGKIQYEYTSPLEFPEDIEIENYLDHIPSKNIDYKRGLLKRETIIGDDSKILNVTEMTYDFFENEEQTGLKFLKYYFDTKYQGTHFEYIYENLKYRYENNQDYTEQCPPPLDQNLPFLRSPIKLHNGNPLRNKNIFIRPIFEAYGWSKLTSKTTRNYFYPNGGSTPNIVQSNETFTYNSLNKQIASHTVDNSKGEVLTTNYFYHTGNSPYSQNRISEIERIETKRGTELLSESKINYSNTFANNASYLPQSVEVKKGSNASEVRLKNNVYDEFGHVLEVQQENGLKISYIYGYNKSQPVAKIENIAYSAIPQNLITAIQNASNGTDEQTLLNALTALRNNPALTNAMITTITYKPLIGVSTMTDPKGDKITYHYDSFNRLEFVKDKDGNILSENAYHYKN